MKIYISIKIKLVLLALVLFGVSCKKDNKMIPLTLPDTLGLTFDYSTNTIEANWDPIEGAKSYTAELSNESGEVIFLNQIIEPTVEFSGLTSGTSYFLRIKANIGNPAFDSQFSDYLLVATRLTAPVAILSNSDGNSLTFTWPAQASANIYFVELSMENGELIKEDETTGTEYTFDDLEQGVSYKFRVRAKSENSESEFSDFLAALTQERPEGFPISWVFAEHNTQKDYLNNPLDPSTLASLQPQWATEYYMKSENISGFNPDAKLSVVNISGEANGFGYNNGHPYLRGMMHNDYWLYTIPVKNFKANTTLTLHTDVTGSGSGPGPFIIEWSTDNNNWTSAGAKTEMIANGSQTVEVTYTFHQGDKLNSNGQPITQDITITNDVKDGIIYIRLRVAADIRVTKNGSSISTTGSTRLMSRNLIVIKE